jgi:hypothetical protein
MDAVSGGAARAVEQPNASAVSIAPAMIFRMVFPIVGAPADTRGRLSLKKTTSAWKLRKLRIGSCR